MNPVLEAARDAVGYGWLLGVMTVFFLLSFAAWVWWAYRPAHREMFEEAAQLPFAEGDET